MPSPFKPERGHRTLLPQFTALDTGREGDALLFVDDYTPMTQFAQSLKLNSLGRLTGSIAHEIRNPLAAVSNAVQLLVENEDMNEGDRELASIVLRNTKRMNDTVNNVLELSRRVPPTLEPIHVSEWLTGIVKDFKESHAKSATLSIKGNFESPIMADKNQMKRVLDNLIDNALRHSEAASGDCTASIEVSGSRSPACVLSMSSMKVKEYPRRHKPGYSSPFSQPIRKGRVLGFICAKSFARVTAQISAIAERPTAAVAFASA